MKKPAETAIKVCPNCLSAYQAPATAGCTICPRCGQRSCGE